MCIRCHAITADLLAKTDCFYKQQKLTTDCYTQSSVKNQHMVNFAFRKEPIV